MSWCRQHRLANAELFLFSMLFIIFTAHVNDAFSIRSKSQQLFLHKRSISSIGKTWRKTTCSSSMNAREDCSCEEGPISGIKRDPLVNKFQSLQLDRRLTLTAISASVLSGFPAIAVGEDGGTAAVAPPEQEVQVVPSGDTKQLFNEGRALEAQGNIPAAQRLYTKVTKIAPRFIYGWSNLGNTQVALGALQTADESYTTAIDLCVESNKKEEKLGVRRCDDLYVLYLNRGVVRLNNNLPKEALKDLEMADSLRARPDAVVLQNRARARELNGLYAAADRDYAVAISMTSNEVNPFWLRSAMVKFQLGETIEALNLLRRVENRFPEAAEVRAAVAAMLAAKGDQTGAQRKYLEIPDRQRKQYVDENYLKTVVSWPPAMIDSLAKVSKAVGDS